MPSLDEPASAEELRQALRDLTSEGYVLVHRDELQRTRLAALGHLDGETGPLRRLILFGLLKDDVTLLAEAIVQTMWREPSAAAAA